MITLYIVSSLEGWPDVMWQAVDASDQNTGPIKDVNWPASYYFVAFILVGSFFFLNFFIGVLFLNFKLA